MENECHSAQDGKFTRLEPSCPRQLAIVKLESSWAATTDPATSFDVKHERITNSKDRHLERKKIQINNLQCTTRQQYEKASTRMTTQTTETVTLPIVGDESIMSAKKHGTSETPVQSDLRWGCSEKTADRICNFNRHYAGMFHSR